MHKNFALPQDRSPSVPNLKSLSESVLYKRRAESREHLDLSATNESLYDGVHANTSSSESPSFALVQPNFAKQDRPSSASGFVLTLCLFGGTGEHLAGVFGKFNFCVCCRITTGMSFDNMLCSRCGEGFEPHEKIVNSTGELWHQQCFV